MTNIIPSPQRRSNQYPLMPVSRAVIVFACLLAGTAHAAAQGTRAPGEHEVKQGRATRVPSQRIAVDGRLSEPEWQQAQVLTDFIQQEPTEGAPSQFRSE